LVLHQPKFPRERRTAYLPIFIQQVADPRIALLGGVVHLVVLIVVVTGFESRRRYGNGELLGLERMHVYQGKVCRALLYDSGERDPLISSAVLFEERVAVIGGVQGIEIFL